MKSISPDSSNTTRRLLSALAGLLCLVFATSTIAADKPSDPSKREKKKRGVIDGNEWPSWRGPDHTGESRAKGLIASWASEDENLLWKVPIGGRSTPIVMNGRVYMLHLTGKDETRQEETVCLDANTGKEIWRYAMDIFLTDIPEERVGWTSPAGDPETGYVYIHGVQGYLVCLDRDGKPVWTHSLSEEFGKTSGFGGRTFTPVIDQDLVIVGLNNSGLGDHGKPATRFLAVDKRTGAVRWWYTPAQDVLDTNYNYPTVAIINGQRLLISGGGDGWIHAMKVNTGEAVWDFHMGPGPVNTAVLTLGNNVYASYSEENITGRIVCIDGTGKGDVTESGKKWEIEGIAAGYSSPALHDGRLYYVDNPGNMHCLDAETGKQFWKLKVGKQAKSSPVWADGRIYYASLGGQFFVLQPGDAECKILSKQDFKAADGGPIDLTGSPAIAYGRVYFVTRDNLYCLGSKDSKPEPITISPLPDAAAPEGDATFIQVIPADVQIPKDAKPKFKARKFDAHGRLIGDVDPAQVTWAANILKGAVASDGTLTPDPAMNGQFGTIEATVGAIKGVARVRIIPTIPIAQDFEKIPEGAIPGSWVGVNKVKFEMATDKESGKVLKKKFDAKILHTYVYIGPTDSKGYTVQADFLGTKTGGHDLADAGVINSRYVFDLMGATQKLRLIGWVPRPSRVSKIIDFKWDPEVWYTLKSRVDYEGSKGIVRGKVWKRGETEPKEWTIELEDPLPYRNGSPGLEFYPMGEVLCDNVKVEKSQ